MHKFIRMWAWVAVLIGTAAAASAATPSEFYLGLLRRGIGFVRCQPLCGCAEAVAHRRLRPGRSHRSVPAGAGVSHARRTTSSAIRTARAKQRIASSWPSAWSGNIACAAVAAEVRTAFEAAANGSSARFRIGDALRGAAMTLRRRRPAARGRLDAAPPSTPPPADDDRSATKPQPSQTSGIPDNPTLPAAADHHAGDRAARTSRRHPRPAKPQTTKPAQTATTQPRPATPRRATKPATPKPQQRADRE